MRVWARHSAQTIRQKPKLDDIFRARRLAVETHVALVLPPLDPPLRAIGALAMDEAQIAICAFCMVLLHAKKREAGKHAQKRAERAQNAAPKARDETVGEKDRHKQKRNEPRLVKIKLLRLPHSLREKILRVIGRPLDRAHVNVLRCPETAVR